MIDLNGIFHEIKHPYGGTHLWNFMETSIYISFNVVIWLDVVQRG